MILPVIPEMKSFGVSSLIQHHGCLQLGISRYFISQADVAQNQDLLRHIVYALDR